MKKTTQMIAMATLCLFLSNIALAQTAALKIGDKLPESFWQQKHTFYSNSKTDAQDLKAFKGKLLILDFWAAWCSACISNFPKLEILQKEFPTEIKILKVSYQSAEQIIKPFLTDIKNNGKPSYEHASIVNDKYLIGLFPNRVLPHYVWIGPDGNVKAITSGDQVTSANVNALIQDADKQLAVKIDQDKNKPLFLSPDLLDEKNPVLSYSLFFKGLYPGLPSGTTRNLDDSGKLIGKSITNLPLVEVYESAAVNDLFKKLGESYSTKKRIVEVVEKDLVEKDYTNSGLFKAENYYTYNRRWPATYAGSFGENVLNDLNQSSGYYGRIEKRQIPCLVISLNDDDSRQPIQSQTTDPTSVNVKDGRLIIRNTEYPHVISILNSLKKIKVPVIDETSIKKIIDLDVTLDADEEALIKELGDYGLKVERTTRELLVFILGDNPEKMNQ